MRVNYRKLYRKHYGNIPVDEKGRPYDIHHIDGDHCNNEISNLLAVPAQEHYNIHYNQSDWGACWAIARRLDLPFEEFSALVKLQQKKLVESGRHNFLNNRGVNVVDSEGHSLRVEKDDPRLVDGTLIPVNKGFVVAKDKNGTAIRVLKTDPRYISGELVGVNKGMPRPGNKGHGLNKGKTWKHSNKRPKVECPHCHKSGDISLMKRHHFDNCKSKEL